MVARSGHDQLRAPPMPRPPRPPAPAPGRSPANVPGPPTSHHIRVPNIPSHEEWILRCRHPPVGANMGMPPDMAKSMKDVRGKSGGGILRPPAPPRSSPPGPPPNPDPASDAWPQQPPPPVSKCPHLYR
jgi:hypothetical protein